MLFFLIESRNKLIKYIRGTSFYSQLLKIMQVDIIFETLHFQKIVDWFHQKSENELRFNEKDLVRR